MKTSRASCDCPCRAWMFCFWTSPLLSPHTVLIFSFCSLFAFLPYVSNLVHFALRYFRLPLATS